MGAPTETYESYKIQCSKCLAERFVEVHHHYEPYEDEDKRLGLPYDIRFKKEGWEFRVTESTTRGDGVMVYIEFVCPDCLAKENEGVTVING